MIRNFRKYHHPIHGHSKYIENLFFIFTLGEKILHEIPREALTFSFLTFHLANNCCIYSHDQRHLFDKSHSFCFLPKDFVGIGCFHSEQICVFFNGRSHILLIKSEAPICKVPKWHNSLNQLFINLNEKQ